MDTYIGIDVGSIGVKVAIKSELEIDIDGFTDYNGYKISDYQRVTGKPKEVVSELLTKIKDKFPSSASYKILFTGSAGRGLASEHSASFVNEFKALLKSVNALYPDVKSILEIGGETSKFITLSENTREFQIDNYEITNDCAAGTGSFIDQQSNRLDFNVEDIGEVALKAQNTPRIAGRCSVFAKSDMIHAQQKGSTPDEILRGLCRALVTNFRSTLIKSNKVVTPVIFVGGVANNKCVVHFIKDALKLDGNCIIPDLPAHMGAIGACILAESNDLLNQPQIEIRENKLKNQPLLTMDKVIKIPEEIPSIPTSRFNGFLGIDIGSVSTNLVVIDENSRILKQIYLATKGRPIEVVKDGFRDISDTFGDKLKIIGVGTTGSGRELIGELVLADLVKDEISAHKAGASFISRKYFDGKEVDTIFEIGGQDSKYISINDNVIVDFAMNEACAAGTGSFLEEQAQKLGINIKKEFAKIALSAKRPLILGERCTVFMELDLNNFLKIGEKVEDILAGLSYSVALNYINKVVRGRKIGDMVFFQGGTAYNDAVSSAFSIILDKKIIVPPYCGVLGALGMALLAKEEMQTKIYKSKFRGFNIGDLDYKDRNFTCRSCSNECEVKEFNIEGEKSYWGDKCSIKYRKKTKSNNKPIIEDLFKFKEELLKGYNEKCNNDKADISIGMPKAMYYFDNFPFWSTFFRNLDFKVITSDDTNKNISQEGSTLVVSDPCFPIKVSHGHVNNLVKKNPDYIFLPNILNRKSTVGTRQSHLCVWGQTLPFVIKGVSEFQNINERILTPTVNFKDGEENVESELYNFFKRFKIKRSKISHALKKAYIEEANFTKTIQKAGMDSLKKLSDEDKPGILLIGRSYNLYDQDINLNIPYKLRNHYGVNIIPMDMISGSHSSISDINDNMFWYYGAKIIQTARFMTGYNNIDIIYFTNFNCGPDSYIKHYMPEANEKPYLVLQFDGHGNDAGFMTRCEAYLASKGII